MVGDYLLLSSRSTQGLLTLKPVDALISQSTARCLSQGSSVLACPALLLVVVLGLLLLSRLSMWSNTSLLYMMQDPVALLSNLFRSMGLDDMLVLCWCSASAMYDDDASVLAPAPDAVVLLDSALVGLFPAALVIVLELSAGCVGVKANQVHVDDAVLLVEGDGTAACLCLYASVLPLLAEKPGKQVDADAVVIAGLLAGAAAVVAGKLSLSQCLVLHGDCMVLQV